MIEHLETVHEEEKQANQNTTSCNKRNLAPTNSSDGEFKKILVVFERNWLTVFVLQMYC